MIWRRVASRVLLTPVRTSLHALQLTIVILLCMTCANLVLLYLRTGAWQQQSYEWYSIEQTGERLFSNVMALPEHNRVETCRFQYTPSDDQATFKSIQDVVSVLSADKTVRVYVVPFNGHKVVSLTEEQIISIDQAHLRRHGHQEQYIRVTPVEELSFFPYLWHSILSEQFSDSINITSPWTRSIANGRLQFQLIRNDTELDALPNGSNILTIVQAMPHVLDLIHHLNRIDTRVAFMALSREDCQNKQTREISDHPQIAFGFFPYGDCSLVDRHNRRFQVIPLGPSFEHGFPINAHLIVTPPKKRWLLNLMVSWTIEKPTRMQAMIAAIHVCDHTSQACMIEHNDLLFKVIQRVDDKLGTKLRWLLPSPRVYVETLAQSTFTLCPFGKNPEQYRIWEALAAGSIPIIEDVPTFHSKGYPIPGMFYHPSYPKTWKCIPEQTHFFLKQFQAPVIFIKDWKRDLPQVIEYYTIIHPQELIVLQQRIQSWYRDAGEHLQAELMTSSLEYFS